MAVPRPSWSRSVTETVRGSHQYTLKGFSLAKGIGPGRHLSSDTFAVGGYDWAVYVYPDGKNHEENASYVSVFVALASEGTDVRALFELTLLDQSGRARHKVHSHFDRSMQAGPYTLKYRGSMWGYKRFFRRTQLETSDFLKDDCLIMNCTVGVVKNRLETPKNIQIDVPPSDIGRCFKELLKLRIGCDITFEVTLKASDWPALPIGVITGPVSATPANQVMSKFRHINGFLPLAPLYSKHSSSDLLVKLTWTGLSWRMLNLLSSRQW